MNTHGSKLLLILILLSPLCAVSYAQEKKNIEEEEINYVWIDTIVKINDSEVRIVSSDIVQITCCMKSPKYSRVSAKTARWIRKNYDSSYEGVPFKTLQNRDLAVTVIEAEKEKAASGDGVMMVDYIFKCD